jgi:carboxypeptidase Q
MRCAVAARRPLAAALFGLTLLGTAAVCSAAPAAPSSSSILSDADRATAVALRDSALQGTRAYDIVSSLTTEVGPRPAGSEAFQRAVEWGVRTLKDLGFQNVHTEKVTLPHWEIGTGEGRITAPWPQPMVLAALGGSVPTPEPGIDAEVVQVPSLDALRKLDPAKAKGKIVFINKRMERHKDGTGYRDTVPGRGAGAAVAGKLGALAVLIRSVGTDNNRTPHTGYMRYDDGGPRIPAAALSNPDADVLEKELASGKPVTFHLKLTSRYLPDVEGANVIGEIRGREKPDEIILLGGHLDSWHLGTGAIDDGAGCAIVIEAARRIGALQEKPRRTIRVILFANEEFGLSGGLAYAKAHESELPKHILAGESDLGSGKSFRLSSRVAPETLPAMDEIAKLVATLGIERGDNTSTEGSDLSPMTKVPILGLSQDATYYFDWHHTANDTLDKIDAKDLDQNVAAWVAVVWAASQMKGDFGRAPEPAPER